ncbi:MULTISPECIES: azurin [Halomonas]|uniref:Azurin n=1 Tax=Halomonas halophila TaxID=29573 RepID=A0ABQ0TZ82_9GAMM|nr:MULTISPECIES: azurin [Halomonas]MDR5889687.1 azurin [Halomonas salina]RAH38891.1 azurin [Halomonas sp. SL1]WJY06369.1 azurin [Halomonas halophila]GEK71544.1 azurin [Halomonas halophila]
MKATNATWLLAATALAATLTAAPAMAQDGEQCQLTIEGNDQMQFNQDAMSVPASCDEVTVTLEHTGQMQANVMGHNWVLTETSDVQGVAQAGMGTGLESDYLPADDDRVLAATDVIGGGESTSVTFSTEGLAGRDLTFFCSFPGHSSLMKGTFSVEG